MHKQNNAKISLIAFNIFVVLASLGVVYFWVLESVYPEFDQKLASAQTKIAQYNKLRDGKVTNYADLIDILGANTPLNLENKKDQAMALVKGLKMSSGFLKALKYENAQMEEKKDEIAIQQDIVGSIVPTFSSDASDERLEKGIANKVDLRRLVTYMEDQVMQKYNFDTPFSVGVDALAFEPVDHEIYKIGSFSLTLPLSNRVAQNIKDFLEVLNNTGKIPLTTEGKMDISSRVRAKTRGSAVIGPTFSLMDNMLIMVDQLSLSNFLQDPGAETTGTITLRFYVRTLDGYETQMLVDAIKDIISGPKDDPDSALKTRVTKFIASADTALQKLCSGTQGTSVTCLKNDPLFADKLADLKSLATVVTSIETKYNGVIAKKTGDTAASAELADIYRQIRSVESLFTEVRRYLAQRLGL